MTPTGVRDGDPDALAGLCDVRGPAVLAYCEVVAGRGERGAAAAAEAFGSFRAGVVLAGDLATLNPEALLISATRHAAARYASSDAPEACARVPELLAARADRSITLADHDWLEEHLASCWTCRAPVARFKVADKAYGEPPDTPLPPAVKVAMVAAMNAAAPVRRETAETPAVDPVEAPRYTNGNSAHAHPEPPTAYDLPAVQADVATYVDQPTSFYEMPAEDLAPPEPAARPRRRGSLLGALGLASSGRSGATATPTDRKARRSRSARAGAAPVAAAPGSARAARRTAEPPAAAQAPDPRAAGGAALPRPRRELSRRPARRRDRGALRPAVVLPVALVVIAIIAALAIAGVFGGGEPASVPQSYAPAASDVPTTTQDKPPVVVVPGAASVNAAAVEKAKARARAAKKKKQAAAQQAADTPATAPAQGAAPPPAAATAPAPPPPANNANNPSGSGTPKIDAGNGATGAEQLPPAKDTSTVPELAPPVQPAAPPPG